MARESNDPDKATFLCILSAVCEKRKKKETRKEKKYGEFADVLARKLRIRWAPPLKTVEPWYFRPPRLLSARVRLAYDSYYAKQTRRVSSVANRSRPGASCPCYLSVLLARNTYILGLIAVTFVPWAFLSPRPLRLTDGNVSQVGIVASTLWQARTKVRRQGSVWVLARE